MAIVVWSEGRRLKNQRFGCLSELRTEQRSKASTISSSLCWENEDQLNLAACFSCCLVSETSCEKRNLGLDRRALVDSEFGFFKDLQ